MDQRRKILFLVTESWYFLSHRIELARTCRDRGWDVVVATRVWEDSPINEPGIRVVPLTMRRAGRHPIRELATLYHVYEILRDERPEILHAVGLKPVLYGATVAPVAGVKRVVTALAGMGYMFTSASLRISMIRAAVVHWLRWALRRKGVLLILQNDDDARMIIKGGVIAPDQLRIVRGSGVDLEHCRAVPEPDGVPVFAVVSRMLIDKGIREVVWAARELQRRNVKAEVWLVGKPDPDNPTSLTEGQLRAWHAEGCIRWVGYQADIPRLWAKAHVAVLPSYREGLPKALLEAAACGRPIITTDVPGCREVVRPGEDGLLVPVNDWLALADAMEKLAGDADLRQRFGSAARTNAEKCFGVSTIIEQVMDVYSNALESTP